MAYASSIVSPCIGCDARCCRSYAVVVTGSDAFRIARGTSLRMSEFLAYRTQPERTATGFLLEPAGPTHDLILRTARTNGGPEPCIFLGEERGGGRCRIYPLRPDACRRFPAMHGTRGITVRENLICPEGAWDGHPMDRLSWRVALAREERHVDLYSDVVRDWNAQVEVDTADSTRTVEQYLEHLDEVYAEIHSTRRRTCPHPNDAPSGTSERQCDHGRAGTVGSGRS